MPRKKFGKIIGEEIPILTLGCAQRFDEKYDKILHRAFKEGVDYLDTALVYADGWSHKTIAPFIEQIGVRKMLWITSKGPSRNATVESYKESAARGSLFSMLNIAIDQSGRLRVLTQKMTKEFLLIAYGHEVEKNKAQLHESITHFERIVTGLVQGDHEMLLLPAPTAELQQQLKDVLQVWEGFRAPLETAIRSGEVAEDHIERVETMNLALLSEAEKVVNMLESL